MVMNSKRMNRLARQMEKKYIGRVGTERGLGVPLLIKKYVRTTNIYGEDTLVLDREERVKGILINAVDEESSQTLQLNVIEGEIRMYIPVQTEVEETAESKFEFIVDEKTYSLVFSRRLGQVGTSLGVTKEITLKPKL